MTNKDKDIVDLMAEVIKETNNYVAQVGADTADRDAVLDLIEDTYPDRVIEIEFLRRELPERLEPRPVAV